MHGRGEAEALRAFLAVTRFDVAIVGAGPAGLAAASSASAAGSRVALIDAYAQPGGQYYKQSLVHAPSFEALPCKVDVAARFFDTTVWSAALVEGDVVLHGECAGAPLTIRARAVVLAPGAYERVLPFPGWTTHGVLTAGAAQSLLKSQRILAGKQIVVAGSGPFLLPVASQLVEHGADVACVVEAVSFARIARGMATALLRHPNRARQALGYLRVLREARVPIRYGSAVVAVQGAQRVERITIARVDDAWKAGTDRMEIEADTVACSYGFLPSTELAQMLGCTSCDDVFVDCDDAMRSSVPGVFVAGEITGIRGAEAALHQGAIAGIYAAVSLGRLTAPQAERLARSHRTNFARASRFAAAINATYVLGRAWHGWLDDSTIVCRCEHVTYASIREAMSLGAQDAREIKATTRCGMGYCQGRMCGSAVTQVSSGTFRRHGVAQPVTLATIADACLPKK